MNEQYSEEDLGTPSTEDWTERETTDAQSAPEPSADRAPVQAGSAYEMPMGGAAVRDIPVSTNGGSSTALLNKEEAEDFRMRWHEIQGKFVDEPRSAVQQADALVSETVEHITQMFANERNTLESQWKQSNDVSTEDLRKALQRYRTFFNRLVG